MQALRTVKSFARQLSKKQETAFLFAASNSSSAQSSYAFSRQQQPNRRHSSSDTMVKAKKFLYAKRFVGEPKPSDFELVEEELPALKENEVLVKAEFHSVDPYMRAYMDRFPVGVQMIGGQVATVIESNHSNYPVGAHVFGQFGWRTHTIFNPDDGSHSPSSVYALPPLGKLPISIGLGVLGMPGNTAYFGFLELCKPKAGETVAITGAAGAVGSIVGQIAKARGCRVVGLAGDDAKCAWLKSLGFDHAINYKTANVREALRAAAPNGYDCYFDNVGGDLSSAIIDQMRDYGRIAVCGAISAYNTAPKDVPRVPILQPRFVMKQLEMHGFLVQRWNSRWQEGLEEVRKLVDSGKVQYQETTTEGFENLPRALIEMLRGGNTGKAVVKSNL